MASQPEDGGSILRNVGIYHITTWHHNLKIEAARSSETSASTTSLHGITTWRWR
jgi:hypothetical protein